VTVSQRYSSLVSSVRMTAQNTQSAPSTAIMPWGVVDL
jgi:hypothetical protein